MCCRRFRTLFLPSYTWSILPLLSHTHTCFSPSPLFLSPYMRSNLRCFPSSRLHEEASSYVKLIGTRQSKKKAPILTYRNEVIIQVLGQHSVSRTEVVCDGILPRSVRVRHDASQKRGEREKKNYLDNFALWRKEEKHTQLPG